MARPVSDLPWLDKRDTGKYYVNWYDPEKRRTHRASLRTRNPETAKERFAAFLAGGADSIRNSKDGRLGVATAVDQYLREHALVRCADPARQTGIAKHLVEFFGDLPVSDVDIPQCRAYTAARRAAPATVKRELGVLVAAANHAKRWKRLKGESLPSIEYPEVPKTQVGFFTVEEVAQLIREAEPRLRAFIVLAYFTAARRKSIETLEMSQIKLSERIIHLHKTGERETAKRRAVVPVNDACVREIQWLAAISETKWLFGKPVDFYRPFKRLCERLGLEDRSHPHLLRHSRATHLLQAGQDLFKVAGLLGDSVTTVERTYGHHTPAHAASAVSPWDDDIA